MDSLAWPRVLLLWCMGLGVHVFLARVGVPDVNLFQTMKTYELERYRIMMEALALGQEANPVNEDSRT